MTGLPFGIAPMGMCNLSRPGADLMLARAAAAGYETPVLTVDVPEVGRRPRELRRGFKMPFRIGPSQFVDFACHPQWSLSTLFRGAPTLANFGGEHGEFDRTSSRAGADWGLLELKEAGVDAIQVSSHGGRQLDSAPPPVLALGADFVFIGRPWLFAIAAGGERGLGQMADVFAAETSIALAQLGLRGIEEIEEIDPAWPAGADWPIRTDADGRHRRTAARVTRAWRP